MKQLKGPTRPFFKQEDRKRVLEALKFVDEVAIFNQPTPYELIKKLGPNIIVKGGDYIPEQVIGNDLCEVRIFNYLDGYSTTSILNNITKEN